jgi:small-conductance mechanosensitive channel
MEGVKVLLYHPFAVGDRVKIGDQEYTVLDMGLRSISLVRPDGGAVRMTYSQLSVQTMTIFKDYSQRGRPGTGIGAYPLSTQAGRPAGKATRQSLVKASLWTIVGVGLAVALPLAPALLPVHALTAWAWLPYVKAAAAMLSTHFLARGAAVFIRRLAEDRVLRPQTAVALKLLVQSGLYLAGGSVALRFFGMTWPALLKSLGAPLIAVGWASSDFFEGFLNSLSVTVGDVIEVYGVTGTVVDRNLSYVVLQRPDKSTTFVSYVVFKDWPAAKLSKTPGPAR